MGEVTVGGRAHGLPAATVERAVRTVLSGERRDATISVTFLGPVAMRTLKRRFLGHDRPTDVIAFALPAAKGLLVGDVYVCPAVARRAARVRAESRRRELLRLVVHGTLHVLGYDHPDDDSRERSPMWRRQERYLGRLK